MATTENAIHTATVASYNYDQDNKNWVRVDGGASRVIIFHNPQTQTYRVIGISAEKKYIINSPIFKGLVYQKISDKFIQWRDTTAIYGLSFISSEDAEAFSQVLDDCIKKLNVLAAAATANIPPPIAQTNQPPVAPKRVPVPPPRGANVPVPNQGAASNTPSLEKSGTYNLLSQPDNLLSNRDKIVKEIYTSENDYVQKLTQLVEQCYHPVDKGKYKNVFSDTEKKMIYGNVGIVLAMNVKFKQDLFARFTEWSDQATVGNIFLQMIPFFRVYKEYFTNYESGTELLEKLSKKKEVSAYLKHCETVADGHRLPYLLIMPVQRIPRYTLLLNELIKNTPPTHPDYDDLMVAVDKLKEFTMNANESVRETEHSKKFIETLKDPKKYVGFDSIVAPHRSLIYECDISVKFGEKEYSWMLIFSDILVFASMSGKKRMVEEKISIEEVWFEDLGSIGPDKLRVITPEKMYLVEPNSSRPFEKQKCITLVEKTIVSYLKGKSLDENGNRRKFIYEYTTGGRYDGEWYVGKPDGQGTFQYPNGNIYLGNFELGRRSGSGKMVYNKNGGIYDGDWLLDKPHGRGKLESRASIYEGEFLNGLKHGNGKLQWPNSDIYEGNWANDRMYGYGTFHTANANYQGYWENNMFHGKGTLVWPGGKYDGHWENDRKSGQGVMTYPNGDVYEGDFKDDQHHGTGTLRSALYSYEGQWDSNRMNGNGVYTSYGKFTYNGSFKDDRKHGQGSLVNEDGSSYEGGWADDRREGQGIWKSSDGEVYDGHWHSDKRFGKGKLSYPGGSSYDGEWVNNRKEGKGTFIWSDGTKYSGNWTSDKRHGKGVLNAPDESYKYAGDWANDYKHGKGVLTDHTGVYEGEWKDDKRDGPGTFTTKTGEVYEGTWAHSALSGEATLTRKDGSTIQLFFVNHCMEKPGFDVLPPFIPPIKLIAP